MSIVKTVSCLDGYDPDALRVDKDAASKRAESAPAPAPALQRDKKGTLKRGSQARQKNA